MRLRGRALAGTAIATVAIALPAIAQDLPSGELGTIKVTPNKAGTLKHPQPVDVRIDTGPIGGDLGPERPPVDKGRILLGKGWLWNGAKHPTCTTQLLNQRGLDACPKGSVFGRYITGGFADDHQRRLKITAVNGGRNSAFAYVQLTDPARVNLAVRIRIEKRTGKWAYELSYDVPPSLEVVAGVPISLPTSLHGTTGKGNIVATTSCPRDRKWKYSSRTTLLDGRVVQYAGTVACRR